MVTQRPDGSAEFWFYRPEAGEVLIAGDFNNWQPSFAMTKEPTGWWRGRIKLGFGTYQFMYVADGQWYADYAAFGLEPSPYGWNSVVRIQPILVSPCSTQDVEGAGAAETDADRQAA